MKINEKKIYAVVITMVISTIMLASCGKGKSPGAVISFYSGTATIQSLNEQPRPVHIQDPVKDGDIIETGDKTSVIIQVGDELLVRFESNTKTVITSMKDITRREIQLEKGKVLSSVSKLKKGNEYLIKTPTSVASVRGTEFLTDFSDGRTVVAVGKGIVSVVKSDTKEEKLVEVGKSVVVSGKMDLREVSKVEALELKKLESTPVIKDIENMTPENLNKQFEDTIKKDEEINREIETSAGNAGMSFQEMKARYNRIDVITMYNGKIIKGVILNRGASLKILTPGGVISVQAKDVQRTGIM